jgi:quinol monooxygenase YgiN
MAQLLTVVAEMRAKPGKEDALRRAVLALIEPTRQEDGCVQYDLHVHSSDPSRFVFYENWTSQEHLDRHAASAHLKDFGAVSADLLAKPPRVETYSRIA